jgi:alcohol dehydrogenase (cytochrome c)
MDGCYPSKQHQEKTMPRHATGLAPAFTIHRMCLFPLIVSLLIGAPAFQSRASDDQWITVNEDYSSQRYVDLDQITPQNVNRLKEVSEINLNVPAWFNSGMLKVGRTIYVNTLGSTFAIDAATCELRWRYDIKFSAYAQASANRGPAYLDGMIFRGIADGSVMALDAKTGKSLWRTQGANPTRRETFLAAPIACDGKVFTGIGISDRDIVGRMMAFDAKTGKELWRFNTIPVGVEPGAETWRLGSVPPAGGGFWTSFSLDPATHEVFCPVANPNPDFKAAARPGDNLYTNCVISLNADTGKLNWYHQAVAGDDHDWDLGAPPTLYRTPGGRNMLAIAGKSGYVLGIDRTTKQVVFKTAGTTIANAGPVDETLQLVSPGVIGGAQWNGTAYHPGLNIVYTGMVDWPAYYSTKDYSGDFGYWVGTKGEEGSGSTFLEFSKRASGWVTAMDGETGKMLWQYHAEGQVLAGLVPTKSGLLFAGDVRGNLLALDAKTGSVLKHFDAKGALNHGLISYTVDGKQYVAAAVGGLTLNANGISGPLRVVVYGLNGSDTPRVVKLERGAISPFPATGELANALAFTAICGSCHSPSGTRGGTGPPLLRQTQMGDSEILKEFLKSVQPPMPILYPGLLEDKDVEMIAAHIKTLASGQNAKLPKDQQLPTSRYVQPTTGGSKEWQTVYSVLTSPRCINCHTATNYPTQGDERHPHVFTIVRGADDHGAPVGRCDACHGDTNNAATGVPGRSAWHIAPRVMSWESAPGVAMTGPELCAQLKDRNRNGSRSLGQLVEHVEKEHLVLWSWDPGTRWNGDRRKTPPVSHEEFVKAFRAWVDAGAPCPTE